MIDDKCLLIYNTKVLRFSNRCFASLIIQKIKIKFELRNK